MYDQDFAQKKIEDKIGQYFRKSPQKEEGGLSRTWNISQGKYVKLCWTKKYSL